jgi:hypothetical protein
MFGAVNHFSAGRFSMKKNHKALLVFFRYPEAGRVKKRLARGLGGKKAAEVYEKLLRRTLGIVCDFRSRNPDVRILLYHTPEDSPVLVRARFSGPWEFRSQEGRHLGERMESALQSVLSAGAGRAVLIGSDLADLSVSDLEEAFERVRPKTAVLGPAADGGFYLIGIGEPCTAPFRFEKWGSADICSRTAGEFSNSGFHVEFVSERKDVDRPEDLAGLDGSFLFHSALSVIVPTLGPPAKHAAFLNSLQDSLWPGDEILLIEGAEKDEISVDAYSDALTCVKCLKGRGIQQNAGAKLAKGNLLFFLHDDTTPPPNFPYLIRRECQDGRVAMGCFRLEFFPSNRLLDLIARWATWRAAVFRLPYGDQGLFCRREIFESAGGFGRKYLFEDVDLVRRCRKYGKLVILPERIRTSSDRFTRKGILAASVQNHMIMMLDRLGVDEKLLYSLYYGDRRDKSGE